MSGSAHEKPWLCHHGRRPAAAGKGTLARRLAGHFGFAFLDTGSLYRGVGLRCPAPRP